MNKFLVLVVPIVGLVVSTPETKRSQGDLQLADECDLSACVLPNCRCSSTDIPGGLDASEIPQLVLLTFDDAINDQNFNYYKKAFFDRTNPDGCTVQATFFVSHEYTNYSMLHEMHAHGQEIAIHSLTHNPSPNYWDNLDVEGYISEFDDNKKMTAYFANVPEEDIQGVRIPLIQLAGNTSFAAMQSMGLKYDCTWATMQYMDPPLWPYTLDYRSTQDCIIGTCPSASFPGLWVQPMVMWYDNNRQPCSMVDVCADVPTTTKEILDFMKMNFHRHYDNNRAPFGFYVHATWFDTNPNNYEAYLLLLDYLGSLSDVYIVSIQRALEWVQNPKPLNKLSSVWTSCPTIYEPTCNVNSCALNKNGETRYLMHCRSTCPSSYPWINNQFSA